MLVARGLREGTCVALPARGLCDGAPLGADGDTLGDAVGFTVFAVGLVVGISVCVDDSRARAQNNKMRLIMMLLLLMKLSLRI